MSILNLTSNQLREAADLIEKIAKLQSQLAAITGTEAEVLVKSTEPAKRKFSLTHLAKIKAAQKKRWAKFQAAKPETAPKTAEPVKRAKKKISAEGIARIKAAQKLRWAKIKGVKTAKPVPVKPAKKKFVMSAEAKAKISAAAKARWAAKKAAEKK
jgi:hypothetical protein